MIGLNATPPPGLGGSPFFGRLPNMPGLSNAFAPVQTPQFQAAPFQPAYSPPPNIQMPDAQSSLAALQQANGTDPMANQASQNSMPGQGITPNSSTPPAAVGPAGGGNGQNAGGDSGAPPAPQSFSDMLNNFAQLSANGLSNPLQNIGGDISGLMSRLFGGQPPNWGARFGGGGTPFGNQPQDGGRGVPPPFATQVPNQGGVLGAAPPAPFGPARGGILGFGG